MDPTSDSSALVPRQKPSRKRKRSAHNVDLNDAKRLRSTLQVNEERVRNVFRAHVVIPSTAVEFFFDDLHDALVARIEEHGRGNLVVGCVAWLSCPRIMAALRGCRRVLLIVNHEHYGKWGSGRCLDDYATLPGLGPTESPAQLFRNIEGPLQKLTTCGFEAVRCVGPLKEGHARFRPLMHNKYAVFFKQWEHEGELIEMPAAVWTGSMNWTAQAGRNLENAAFYANHEAALAYFHDFALTFYKSSSLEY